MNTDGPVLRDIHLPAEPAWWPPAPGWWLLVALAILVLVLAFRGARRRLGERRWRHRIVAELDPIVARHARGRDDVRLAADLSNLLRRAARVLEPTAAALHGEAWLRFLDSRIGGDAFAHGPGRVLVDAPWRKSAELDTDALVALVRGWLVQAFAAERRRA